MGEPARIDSRTPTVVFVDRDPGQLRLFEAQFADRFRLTLSSSGQELLGQVHALAPVAALLADHDSGRGLLEAAPEILPDTERLLVTRSWELPQARAAVARGTAKRFFVKPWIAGEVGEALEDAVRIFELRCQVRALRARLQQSERFATVGRVSAGIAHELAGPAAYVAENAAALHRELAGVAAYVRRMTLIRPDARVLERLKEVSEIVQDVEAGAEHVRKVSRGITGQLRSDAPIQRCDIQEIAEQVARLVRPELQGRAILSTGGGELEVLASPLRLTQVLINLVVNAAQAVGSMERDDAGRVRVRWMVNGSRGRIEVSDDGPGLPDEVDGEHELLVSTKPQDTGTGLGLWLCRELVAEMAGTLELKSLRGQGTVARIELPRPPD